MPEHAPTPVYSRAIYGYALFLMFKSVFMFYLFWIYTPHEFLRKELGLTFLPNKYFALFLPIVILTTFWLFVFVFYPTMGVMYTPALDSKNTITDSFSSKSGNKTTEPGTDYKLKALHEFHKFDNKDDGEFCDCAYTTNCMKSSEMSALLKYRSSNLALSDIDIKTVSAKLYSN